MSGRYPDWVTDLTDDILVRHFGHDTVQRAAAYARDNRISRISVVGNNTLITAQVRGSRTVPYQCAIHRNPTTSRSAAGVHGNCSCPMQVNCKHVVALLLHMRDVTIRRNTPNWQRVLATVGEQARNLTNACGAPLALEFTYHRLASVEVRPLTRGVSGKWVRANLDWESIRYPHRHEYVEAQRQALANLRVAAEPSSPFASYYQRSVSLSLTGSRPELWPALRAAQDAGVVFVSSRETPPVRLLPDRIDVVSELRRAPDGSLALEGHALVNGEHVPLSRQQLLGNPPHGVVLVTPDELVLGGFDEPLNTTQIALVAEHPRLEIPAADVPDFFASYYPALRRLIAVQPQDGLELPEFKPPILRLTVTPHPDHAVTLHWGFRYQLGDRVLDVDVQPSPTDPPVRDEDLENALIDTLPPGSWSWQLDAQERRRLPKTVTLVGREALSFVTHTLGLLEQRDDVIVTIGTGLARYAEAAGTPEIRLSISEPAGDVHDWFDLSVDVRIDGHLVPFLELFTALNQGRDHLVLDSGTWFPLDAPEFAQLRQLIDEARLLQEREADTLRLRPVHAGLWDELVQLGVIAQQSAAWEASARALLDLTELPPVQLPTGLHATLRPYQEMGLRWLSFLWHTRLGGILADDMGLGKTVQALALAALLHENGELDHPILVVAPTSVLGTWAAEAARFTPGLRVQVIPETSAKRGSPLAEALSDADLVITSYTLVRLDAEEYADRAWSAVILDEAQFVKNRQSKAYLAVRRLRARAKFAVTGTPLENNLMDLWSMLSITSPGLFPDPKVFTDRYRRPIESGSDQDALARLHRRIRPLLLRRTKESVAAELPPKQEQVIPVALSPSHRRVYDKHLQRERQKVLNLVDDLAKNRITILRSLTLLRQLSLAPGLVSAEYDRIESSKLDVLVELLQDVVAGGHRALVFSQFTSFLSMVRDRLKQEGIGTVYLDGRTRDRQARIETFRGGNDPVFLISLKAGGFGLTLTEADYVFVLDPWWNPAAENQAVDRTHRIGQDKQVMVYRLVAEHTIEEKVVALQQRKRDLFSLVVGEEAQMAAPLTAEDIKGLLEL